MTELKYISRQLGLYALADDGLFITEADVSVNCGAGYIISNRIPDYGKALFEASLKMEHRMNFKPLFIAAKRLCAQQFFRLVSGASVRGVHSRIGGTMKGKLKIGANSFIS